MKKEKLKILVCCHKADSEIRTEAPYLPIQVGKALHPDLDLGFQNDNEGDNISAKNPQWCELTALYWGWKNLRDVEYLGLCHYRRYFDCDFSNVDKLLKGKDVLLLEREIYYSSVATGFASIVSLEDLYIYQDVLLKHHPEYYNALLKYCYNSNQFVRCTMFVAKKEIYDDFCSSFFPVFEEIEGIIRKYGYSRLNRSIAYMGELSLGIYVIHNNLKCKFVPQDVYSQKKSNKLLYILRRIKHNLIIKKRVIGFKLLSKQTNKIKLYDAVVLGLKNDGITLQMET